MPKLATSRVLWLLLVLARHAVHPHGNPNKPVHRTMSVRDLEIQFDDDGEGAPRHHSDIVSIVIHHDTLSTDRSYYQLSVDECPLRGATSGV